MANRFSSRPNGAGDRSHYGEAATAAVPRLPKIAVVDFHPTASGGALRALASVQMGNYLTIHGWRVIQQPGHAAWVSVPQEVRDEPDPARPGQVRRRYYPRLEVHPCWQAAIAAALIAAWDAYQRGESPWCAPVAHGQSRTIGGPR